MTIDLRRSRAFAETAGTPVLTIAIPTWNRCGKLQRQLDRLEPHLGESVEVFICDNRSDDGTWLFLEGWLAATPTRAIAMRNGINLGADENYLRVVEAASGRWVWLIGDDDELDFSVLPELLGHLSTVDRPVVLMLDRESDARMRPAVPPSLDAEVFFARENDDLGHLLLQVSRVLCRTEAALPLLRTAHAHAVGHLHAYLALYAPLIVRHGLSVLTLPLALTLEVDPPRWNKLAGHLGAWRTTRKAFSDRLRQADERERRLRQSALLRHALVRCLSGRGLAKEDRRWMTNAFDAKGRLALLALRAGSAGPWRRRIMLRVLGRIRPAFAGAVASNVVDDSAGY